MTTEKYENIYTHFNHSPDEIRGMLRDLDDPGLNIKRDEKQMKREALEKVLRKSLAAVRLIILLLICIPSMGQTIAEGEILITEDRYFVEAYDYEGGKWQWVNVPFFDYGRYHFYVEKFDRMDWRVIACSDTTYYSIYGAPERTKIDTAVPADGGHHTIGVNPYTIIE